MRERSWIGIGARLACLLMALSAAAAESPEPYATWAKVYGGSYRDTGQLLKDNGDGTFFISGSTAPVAYAGNLLLMKVDSSGAVLWQASYGSAADDNGWMDTTPDGGFAAFITYSPTALMTLMKLDGSGGISLQQSYGTTGDTYSAAQVLPDGQFLLSGSTFSLYPTQQGTLRLMKLDSGGNILWQKKYSSPTRLLTGIVAIPLEDGTYLATVTSMDLSYHQHSLLMKLDAGGGILAQKSYDPPTGEASGSFMPASDGGLLFEGTYNPDPYPGTGTIDVLIAKTDASGNITWQKTYGGAKSDGGFLLPIPGGFLLNGWTQSYAAGDNSNALLAKLDATGNVLWAKVYGGTQEDWLAASADSAGGYLLQGSTLSYASTPDYNEFWAVKVDDGGEIQWQRAFGGSQGDGTLLRTGDGGLLLTGATQSAGAGDYDIWIWKLNAQGQLGYSCPITHDTDTTANTITLGTGIGTLVAGSSDIAAADATYTSASGAMARNTLAFAGQDACSGIPVLAAHASADPAMGNIPLTVQFTGSATGGTPPYGYSWNFADGSPPSTEQNPSHTYASAGNFSVLLTVTDAIQSVATQGLAITAGGSCTVTCATTVPSDGMAGDSISFTSTYDATGCTGAPRFTWTFGDGTNPEDTQNTIHTYAVPGTYTWSYTVNVGGNVCNGNGVIAITQGVCALECFVQVPASGTTGTAVAFIGSASPHHCTGTVAYTWAFGDGGSSTEQTPSHVYAAAGTYGWTMTATVDGVPCAKAGSITIAAQSAKPGDCNGDGTVSIGEVQKAINMFLGVQALDCGVDCNGDGTVSIGEVQKVINGFLGLQSSC